MKMVKRTVLVALVTLVLAGPVVAEDPGGAYDAEALEVLTQMDAYTGSLERFVVKAESYRDFLYEGAVVNNPSVMKVAVDRSGMLRSVSFDGEFKRFIYVNNGRLTLYGTEKNFFAQVDVPLELGEALLFALDEYDIETPLLDLVVVDHLDHFLTGKEELVYLTDKSPIRGVNCHHIAVRGPNIDLQIWVATGERPVPLRTLMTFKGEIGPPRHDVFMEWNEQPDLDASIFEFEAPEGSSQIKILSAQ